MSIFQAPLACNASRARQLNYIKIAPSICKYESSIYCICAMAQLCNNTSVADISGDSVHRSKKNAVRSTAILQCRAPRLRNTPQKPLQTTLLVGPLFPRKRHKLIHCNVIYLLCVHILDGILAIESRAEHQIEYRHVKMPVSGHFCHDA